MFSGKKTYTVAILMLLRVVYVWYTAGQLDVNLLLEAFGLGALRNAIAARQ